LDTIYKRVKIFHVAKKFLYHHAPNNLLNMGVLYVQTVLRLPSKAIQLMYKSELLQSTAYIFPPPPKADTVVRGTITKRNRDQDDLYLAVNNMNKVEFIDGLNIDDQLFVDPHFRNKYYENKKLIGANLCGFSSPSVSPLNNSQGQYARLFTPPSNAKPFIKVEDS